MNNNANSKDIKKNFRLREARQFLKCSNDPIIEVNIQIIKF